MAEIVFYGNSRTAPRWLADFGGRHAMEVFPAKLDKASFANAYGVDILVTGIAAQGATSIAVAALTPPAPAVTPISSVGSLIIKAGSTIVFNAAAGKLAYVTADAKLGDTSIAVAPLPTALAVNDDAKWNRFGTIFVPSGILVGRTFASRDSGTALFEPGDPSTQDECFLTYFDVADLERNNDVELLRIKAGVTVKINYLPGYATLSGPVLAYINANYRTIKGVN